MSDPARMPDPARMLLALPDETVVVFRHYAAPDRAAAAAAVVAAARRIGLRVIVAGDIRLALRVGADGVHLPGHMLRRGVRIARAGRPRRFLITAAVHDMRELRRADRVGVDAVLLSPVFPTRSHADRAPLGLVGLQRLARQSPLPAIALGGVATRRLARLRGTLAAGCAGISLFTDSGDIGNVGGTH